MATSISDFTTYTALGNRNPRFAYRVPGPRSPGPGEYEPRSPEGRSSKMTTGQRFAPIKYQGQSTVPGPGSYGNGWALPASSARRARGRSGGEAGGRGGGGGVPGVHLSSWGVREDVGVSDRFVPKDTVRVAAGFSRPAPVEGRSIYSSAIAGGSTYIGSASSYRPCTVGEGARAGSRKGGGGGQKRRGQAGFGKQRRPNSVELQHRPHRSPALRLGKWTGKWPGPLCLASPVCHFPRDPLFDDAPDLEDLVQHDHSLRVRPGTVPVEPRGKQFVVNFSGKISVSEVEPSHTLISPQRTKAPTHLTWEDRIQEPFKATNRRPKLMPMSMHLKEQQQASETLK